MIKLYSYAKCSTCRKAQKYLDQKGLTYELKDITEEPPSKAELKSMLQSYDGELKKLFNTSGQMYRELSVKDKLPVMSESDAITLLSQHGKLIKRPFLVSKKGERVGFKDEEWNKIFP